MARWGWWPCVSFWGAPLWTAWTSTLGSLTSGSCSGFRSMLEPPTQGAKEKLYENPREAPLSVPTHPIDRLKSYKTLLNIKHGRRVGAKPLSRPGD